MRKPNFGALGSVELEDMPRPRHRKNLESGSSVPQDDIDLARAGKNPVLKRKFGFMSILGFSCLVLGEWESSYFTFQIGFSNGGPAGLIYGYILVWAGTMATFCSLAELASMAPVAAGQYHWISLLSPRSSQRILSYVTGWLTVLGWQCSIASSAFALAGLLESFIELVNPSYVPKLWHATLLYYACILFAVFVTVVLGSALSQIESVLLVLYIVGFFAVLIPLVYLAPHGSAHEVFTTFINNGGWSTQGLSFMIGLSGNAFAFLGADSIYHMSEEIKDAATVVPKAIVTSIAFNGAVGLASFIALLFCIGNTNAVLDSPFSYPFMEVFLEATHSVAGSAVMSWIIIVLQIALVIGAMAAASRMLWSFARDRGLPGWRFLSRVNPHTSVPQNAVFVSAIFSILVGLISVGSPLAFNDILSMAVSALYASYFAASFGLLCRRVTGSIKTLDEVPFDQQDTHMNLPGAAGQLVWGPWRVPGLLGTAVNAFACAYLAVIFVFTFWPVAVPVDATSMNYDILVFGAVALLSAVYYAVWARKSFEGPVVEDIL